MEMGQDHKHDHHGHHHHHAHHHGHHHAHHGHDHSGRMNRLGLAFALNFAFAIVELFGGFYTNSVAILSGALHDLGDCLAILFALILEKVSVKKSDPTYSYGYRRYSPLAALCTGMVLILGSVFIVIQAVPRLIDPVTPKAEGMLVLALLGIAVNGFAAYRVSKGGSLNERMVMWHLMEDVLGWVLVLISAVCMMIWKIPQVDAALAIVLAFWILYNVFRNLKEGFQIFLQAAPSRVNQSELVSRIRNIPTVKDMHHFHIWSLDGEHHVFTTHLVLEDHVTHRDIDSVKEAVKKIATQFHIMESTIEIEFQSSQCIDPEH
jgi:cobalt-zinc-cadmium efflux system protein